MFDVCLLGVWKVPRIGLKGVWKVSWRCFLGVWRVFWRCLKGFYKVSGDRPSQNKWIQDKSTQDMSSQNIKLGQVWHKHDTLNTPKAISEWLVKRVVFGWLGGGWVHDGWVVYRYIIMPLYGPTCKNRHCMTLVFWHLIDGFSRKLKLKKTCVS